MLQNESCFELGAFLPTSSIQLFVLLNYNLIVKNTQEGIMSSISIVGKSRRVIDTPEYTIDELAGMPLDVCSNLSLYWKLFVKNIRSSSQYCLQI